MRNIVSQFEKTSVKTRSATDKMFRPDRALFEYSGYIDKSVKWFQNMHLLNPKMWEIFVDQFRTHYGKSNTAPEQEPQGTFQSDDDLGWRGEFWGKMMRSAVSVYVYTRDERLYDVLTDTVKDLLGTQDSLGRFSSYSKACEFGNWDIWCRKYVMLGLQYYYDICRDEALRQQIISALVRHTDYIISKIGKETDGKREITDAGFAHLGGINASSLLEPVVRMYNMTGEQRFIDFAAYIVNSGGTKGENIFELAYVGKKFPYEYKIKKGYEMMSCFEGLIEYYRASGIEKYRVATENFVRLIAESEITEVGGAGCAFEMLDNAAITQTESLSEPGQETCTTITWMKLCMQLLFLTGDPYYAELIEKSGYNALLGALNTGACHFDFEHHHRYLRFNYSNDNYNGVNDLGMPFDSYSPTIAGVRGADIGGFRIFYQNQLFNYDKEAQKTKEKRLFYTDRSLHYGCCGAAGGTGLGLFADVAVCYTNQGVAFNWYFPGRVNVTAPDGSEAIFTMETEYPRDGKLIFTVEKAPECAMRVDFRIPSWSKRSSVMVCGENVDAEAGKYLSITREWTFGDKVCISFDMTAHVIKQNGFAAIKRGPVVFAVDEKLDGKADRVLKLAENSDGSIDAKLVNDTNFDCICCISIPTADGEIKLCDYSSAGKTWENDKKMAFWFPIND